MNKHLWNTVMSPRARRAGSTVALLAFCGSLAACPPNNGPGKKDGSTDDASSSVEVITISPQSPTVPLGLTIPFTATGTLSDGSTSDVTADTAWASSDETVGTITADGHFTAVKVGSTTVTATHGKLTASTLVNVTIAQLKKIDITPSTLTIAEGKTLALKATGTYTDDTTHDVTGMVSWHSDAPSVALVDSTGLLTAEVPGTAGITANIGSIVGNCAVTVKVKQMVQLDVSPMTTSLAAGLTVALSATGTYDNDQTENVTSATTWTSEDSSIATVSSTGVVTCVAVGTVTITAQSSELTATSEVTCTAAQIVSNGGLTLAPSGQSVPAGLTLPLTLTARYTDGTVRDLTADPSVTYSSNHPNIASIPTTGSGLVTTHIAGTVVITATVHGDGATVLGTATATVLVGPPQLVSIAITRSDGSSDTSTPLGVPVQYVATGTYTDGSTRDLTTSASPGWSSSDPTIANVQLGVVTTSRQGNVTITVQSGTVSATTSLTVGEPRLTSVAVTPGAYVIPLGAQKQMTATGTYTDGSHVEITTLSGITWSSSDPTVVTAGATTGILKGVQQRSSPSVTITATVNGISGTAQVTVGPPVLASITVAPASGAANHFPKGQTLQLVASGTYTDGNVVPSLSSVTWTSSNSAIATVSLGGLVTGQAQGMVTISASSGGVTGTLTLTIDPPTIIQILLFPPNATVALGLTLQLTATGVLTDGTQRNLTNDSTWNSTDVSVATVGGGNGLVQSVAQGTTQVTASYNGITSAPLAVTVGPPVVTHIDLLPASNAGSPLLIPLGASQQMTAIATFSDLHTEDLTTSVTWSSTNATVAFIGNDGLITTSNTQGSVTIEAVLGTVDAIAQVTVGPPALVSIDITPIEPHFALGTELQLTAKGTYTNHTQKDLTSQLTWSSADPSIADVGSDGLATNSREGIVTITATSDDAVTGSVLLTVDPPALVAIDITVPQTSFPLGTLQQAVATGTYTFGEPKDITSSPDVDWTTSDPTRALVTAGLIQSRGQGPATITAKSGTVTASVQITILAPEVISMTIDPPSGELPVGRNANFRATATFTDHTTGSVTASAYWSSSDESVASVGGFGSQAGQVVANSIGTTTITATIGDIAATATVTVTPAVLDSIVISSDDGQSSFPLGKTLQLRATGTYSDQRTQDLTNLVPWVMTDLNVATIDTHGLVTGVAAGSTAATVNYQGQSAGFPIIVLPPDIVSIKVTPVNLAIPLGRGANLTATAQFTDGHARDVTTLVEWKSEDTTVAEVAQNGAVSSVAVGATTVSATKKDYLGNPVTGSSNVVVNPHALVSLQITQQDVHLPLGKYMVLTLMGTYTDGAVVDVTTDAAWSTIPQVQSFIAVSYGVITTSAQGTATVQAKLDGVSATTVVTVGPPVLESMYLNPTNPTVAVGTTTQMMATGLFSDSTVVDITQVVAWSTTAPLIATVDTAGRLKANGKGTATITAYFQDITATTLVVVGDAVLASLTLTPNSVSMPKGTTKQMKATATWTDGHKVDVTTLCDWTTAEPDVATVTSETTMPDGSTSWGLIETGMYESNTTVSAHYCTDVTTCLTANVSVRVTAHVLVSITLSPQSPTVPVPLDQQITADGLYSDGEHQDVTNLAHWTSSNNSVATVTNNVPTVGGSFCTYLYGCVKAITPGGATIAATIGSISGTTTVAIGGATVTSVSISPEDPTVNLNALSKGDVVVLQAFAKYSTGDQVLLTSDVTWESTQPSVASVTGSDAGTVTCLAQGGATIKATYNGILGSTTVLCGPVSLKYIVITPTDPTLYAGQVVQLTVTGVKSDATTVDLTASTTWESDSNFIAKVLTGGILKGFSEGETVVTATASGKTATINVTVTPPRLVQMQVVRVEEQYAVPTCSTSSYTTANGMEYRVVAIARYSDGTTKDLTHAASWALLPVSQSVAFGTLEDDAYVVRSIYGQTGSFQIQTGYQGVTGTVAVKVN